jgi:ribonuclease HII
MPWVVGIDEAGYGPNLGPLVQASVALYLPGDDRAGWKTLRRCVCRCGEKPNGRLLVDDSKQVYTRHGLAALELGVHAMLGCPARREFRGFLDSVSRERWFERLAQEFWFDAGEFVPLEESATECLRERVKNYGARIGTVAAILTPTAVFNHVVDHSDSKATLLMNGLCELVANLSQLLPLDQESVVFQCDKLGGRNFYAGLLQDAFPDGWIVPECESGEESRYRIDLLDRPITVVFRPRADADSVAVALASMLCKYLRELCMLQFNRFWATQIPGIKPTAGYPGDSKRFFDEIKPAMEKLGLTDDQVWRKR